MTADGTPGAKNQPQFLGTGAPATAADMNTLANYAAKVGNSKTGTNADRLALAGNDVWDGLTFVCTDTGVTWVRRSGAWVVALLRPLNATAPTVLQHGRTSVTTDSSGYFTATFAIAFPTACDRVIATSADGTAYFGGVAITGMTASQFTGRMSINNATFNLDWIAVGR